MAADAETPSKISGRWPSLFASASRVLHPLAYRSPLLTSHSQIGFYLRDQIAADARLGGRAADRARSVSHRLLNSGNDLTSMLLAARLVRLTEGLSRASSIYRTIAGRWPNTMLSHVVLAEQAMRGRNRSAAREHLEHALDALDDRAVMWSVVLEVVHWLGDRSLASSAVRRYDSCAGSTDASTATEMDHLARGLRALGRSDSPESAHELSNAAAWSPKLAKNLLRWLDHDGNSELFRQTAAATDPDTLGAAFTLSIAKKLRAAGDFSVSTRFARTAARLDPKLSGAQTMVQTGESALAIMDHGWKSPSRVADVPYEPEQRTVTYLVSSSLPHTSVGYATRTQGLLGAMRRANWDVQAATSLGFPYDSRPSSDHTIVPSQEVVDGVVYHRLVDHRRRYRRWPLKSYVDDYASHVARISTHQRASVIHAASNYVNGLAGIAAARRLGLPVVYEVRGLWELTRSAREPGYERSELFDVTTKLEVAACRDADHVLTITNALRDEMVRRGVPADKITVLPNGVDIERFRAQPRDATLATQLRVQSKTVIGYVGSVLEYEGIDLLLRAAARLRTRREDFHVLVVGDGSAYQNAVTLAAELGVSDLVSFTGRVPHDEVARYYSLVDIAPFPRLPLPVCEMVSPLKPLEAMAMGKAPVVSSVAALNELISDGETGLVFPKGDVNGLVTAIDRLLDDKALRLRIGRAAQAWVERERNWSTLATTLATVYAQLPKGNPKW